MICEPQIIHSLQQKIVLAQLDCKSWHPRTTEMFWEKTYWYDKIRCLLYIIVFLWNKILSRLAFHIHYMQFIFICYLFNCDKWHFFFGSWWFGDLDGQKKTTTHLFERLLLGSFKAVKVQTSSITKIQWNQRFVDIYCKWMRPIDVTK